MKFLLPAMFVLALALATPCQSDSTPDSASDSAKYQDSETNCTRIEGLTEQTFQLIQKGMTKDVVRGIVGNQGCVISSNRDIRSDGTEINESRLNWESENGAELVVVFENDIAIDVIEVGTAMDKVKRAADLAAEAAREAAIKVAEATNGASDKIESDVSIVDYEPEPQLSLADESVDYRSRYDQLTIGMRYADVIGIIGAPGIQTRSSTSENKELRSYKWEGANYLRIYVNFKDDRLTSKSQTGLRQAGNDSLAEISMDKYEQILHGMSVLQVELIIGSKGEETSSSSIGPNSYKSYRWKGEKFSFISVRFKNDQVNSKSQYGLEAPKKDSDDEEDKVKDPVKP